MFFCSKLLKKHPLFYFFLVISHTFFNVFFSTGPHHFQYQLLAKQSCCSMKFFAWENLWFSLWAYFHLSTENNHPLVFPDYFAALLFICRSPWFPGDANRPEVAIGATVHHYQTPQAIKTTLIRFGLICQKSIIFQFFEVPGETNRQKHCWANRPPLSESPSNPTTLIRSGPKIPLSYIPSIY